MVVARSNKTRYIDLSASLERFDTANIPLPGVVLNGYPRKWPLSLCRRRRKALSIAQILTADVLPVSPPEVANDEQSADVTASQGISQSSWRVAERDTLPLKIGQPEISASLHRLGHGRRIDA
jgi:hypothetical protein